MTDRSVSTAGVAEAPDIMRPTESAVVIAIVIQLGT